MSSWGYPWKSAGYLLFYKYLNKISFHPPHVHSIKLVLSKAEKKKRKKREKAPFWPGVNDWLTPETQDAWTDARANSDGPPWPPKLRAPRLFLRRSHLSSLHYLHLMLFSTSLVFPRLHFETSQVAVSFSLRAGRWSYKWEGIVGVCLCGRGNKSIRGFPKRWRHRLGPLRTPCPPAPRDPRRAGSVQVWKWP